jgi:hypothetical protein
MPDTVIARVNELGKGQPEELVFTDRRGRLIGDVELPGVDEGQMDVPLTATEPPQHQIEAIENDVPAEFVEDDLDIDDNLGYESDTDPVPAAPPVKVEPDDTVGDAQPTNVPVEDPVPATVDNLPAPAPENPVEIPGVGRPTRNRKPVDSYIPSMTGQRYAYAVTQLDKLEDQTVLHPNAHMFFQDERLQPAEPDVVAAIMTQLSLKAGLKNWGERGYKAAHAEMKQLHMRDTFKPLHWKDMTKAQRKSILESHLFLKEKRSGEIKGRTVAGGNKQQRDFISKEDASSPTVSTEAVLLTAVIAAEEGRDVAVVDIPNAFIQTRIEDEADMAIIRIRGVLVDMLVDIAPDVYKPYVTVDKKGVKSLIVQCLNAIYGTMVASLLYYRKFCKSLTSYGFEFNPYDPCVANKMVNGKQLTIGFHVDDCMLSHVDSKVIDKMIEWLKQRLREDECESGQDSQVPWDDAGLHHKGPGEGLNV